NSKHFAAVLLGISSGSASSVAIFNGTEQGLKIVGALPLSAPASTIAVGDLDGDSMPDAAVLSGGQVAILHSSSLLLEPTSLPGSVSAMALGSFIFDRSGRIQIALLTSDGTIHIAAHSGFDPHNFTAEENAAMHRAVLTQSSNSAFPLVSTSESWKVIES